MQQFTVPQFIDVEEKVIGPITVRQFLILLSASMFLAACYKLLYFNTFLVVAVIILLVAGVFAFGKVNGVNFHVFFVSFLITMTKSNIRVWNNAFGKENLRIETEKVLSKNSEVFVAQKNISASRLAELSLIVDTQGVFQGNDPKSMVTPNFTKEVHKRDF